jgi:hypothetical protein
VHGVKEDRATSGAAKLIGVDTSDTGVRGFRSKLVARLNPAVSGLAIEPFPPRVPVIQVPESPEIASEVNRCHES